jgi:hypothetical protein
VVFHRWLWRLENHVKKALISRDCATLSSAMIVEKFGFCALFHRICGLNRVGWSVDGRSALTDRPTAIWSIPLPTATFGCGVVIRSKGMFAMLRHNEVSNKDVSKSVNQRLSRTGTSGQSRVTANVSRGVVTLVGTLNHEMQRRGIVQAASRAAGVRQVIDQLTLTVKKKY